MSSLSPLTSHEALQLTARFAFAAERIRAAESICLTRASLCETASRISFLRAHMIAKNEELRPAFGELLRRAAFAVA